MPADQLICPRAITPDATVRAVLSVLAGTDLREAASRTRLAPADLATAISVFKQAGHRAIEQQSSIGNWWQLYIEFTNWTTAESIAADHLAPLLHHAESDGTLVAWWFIRKHPCWRLRLQLPLHDSRVKAGFTTALDELSAVGHIQCWWPTLYEAETPAFGGSAAMHATHQLFHTDSHTILNLPSRKSPLGRRELSILLCTVLIRAAGLEWYEQGDVWHRVSEERPLPADIPADRLQGMVQNVRTLLSADIDPDGPLLGPNGAMAFASPWAVAFNRTGQTLGAAAREGTLERGLRHVLSYHVIFHWNRLGLPMRTQSALAWAARTAIMDPLPPSPRRIKPKGSS
ncbi:MULTISPECIES: thiopeptide-type bacteriocin biosynthesis protein [unclassified Streptomyces]|uniref:thiopeptide-type bacteriocin biosynthesis protein n=1 Tax=unclassified Streptomyces TaxID=2593676 RepID=UPI00380B9BCD